MAPRHPSRSPSTWLPELQMMRTAARMTALRPGQSPPPVRIPTFIASSRVAPRGAGSDQTVIRLNGYAAWDVVRQAEKASTEIEAEKWRNRSGGVSSLHFSAAHFSVHSSADFTEERLPQRPALETAPRPDRRCVTTDR